MYYLMGFKRNLRNVQLLSRAFFSGPSGQTDFGQLKRCYRNYLRVIQPDCTLSSRKKTELVSDTNQSKQLLNFYLNNTNDFDLRRLRRALERPPVQLWRQRKIKILQNGLQRMRRIDPDLATLFNLVINKVFYYEFADCSGGSTPDAYGIIYAIPKLSWGPEDVIEYYVHELTHNLLYLDEECHPHYRDYAALNLKKNYAYSTIRRVKRRLDQALHSLVVATEILLLRKKKLGHFSARMVHPNSNMLIASCEATIKSIRSLQWRALLAPRGREILISCQKANDFFRKKIKKNSLFLAGDRAQ